MTTLPEILTSDANKSAVIADCLTIVDQEVADKKGLTGIAIKAGYKAVQGVKPGFVRNVMTDLLPEFAAALDPIYQEAKGKGAAIAPYFIDHKARVADALLGITDKKAQGAKSGLVKKTYEKLRPTAKSNVEDAVPRLGRMVEKHGS